MKAAKVELIKRQFRNQFRNEDREYKLIELLEQEKWESQTDKKVYLEGLKSLAKREGVPYGFSLSVASAAQIEEFLCEAFIASTEIVLPQLHKTKRLPARLKVLILEEYLKFYSIESGGFHLFFLRPLCPRIQTFVKSEEGRSLLVELLSMREILSEQAMQENRNSPNGKYGAPINLLKRILRDDYFQTEFKEWLLDFIFPTVGTITDAQLKDLRKVYIRSSADKKFFFSSTQPNNKQYSQFKKNLLFSYFSVVYWSCKFDGEPIKISFKAEVLDMTELLNEEFYAELPPIEINAGYVKSVIKDFYGSGSKRLASH